MTKYGNKKEYAAHRECTPAYLSKADVKERLDQAYEIDPADKKWKINFEKADRILAASADPARVAPDTPPPVVAESNAPKFHDYKTDREKVKLTQDTLELERSLGNTLDRQKTVDACIWWASAVMDASKARNRRMGEILSTLTDPREIKAELDKSDFELFRSLSDDFREKLSLPNPAPDQSN